MPSPDGSTVQVNEVLATAPEAAAAVTVTVLVPAADGVPLRTPELEMDTPDGSPVALNVAAPCPLTGTDTARPARPSCGPGLVIVTGWPSWAAATGKLPDSGRLASES